MAELKQGTKVRLTTGAQVKVIKELGRGGQGIVYLCEFNGQQYALKWYIQKYPDEFYKNLKLNVNNGSPSQSNAFLWPLMLAEKQLDSFGYVMRLRPTEYKEFGDFLLAKTKFETVNATLNAALQICDGFHHLHINGYSYQDLNDGNFFMNPKTGDVLICDNDNVTAQGQNLGIAGKMRYMAPEVVLGQRPDTYSDHFSLAVMLFLIFFKNHPLEGQTVLSVPCMTESHEKKFYGSEALFIYDANNKANSPVKGVHRNVLNLWPAYPEVIRNSFMDAFGQDKLKNPTKRLNESKWQKTFVELRNLLVIDENGEEKFLKATEKPKYAIHTSEEGTIALSPKKDVFIGKALSPTAKVRTNKSDPSVWALQNLTKETWMVETASGKIKQVAPNDIMPTKPGLKISFPGNIKGTII